LDEGPEPELGQPEAFERWASEWYLNTTVPCNGWQVGVAKMKPSLSGGAPRRDLLGVLPGAMPLERIDGADQGRHGSSSVLGFPKS